MFIRFVTPRRDPRAWAEVGIFGPAYALRNRYSPANAPWQVHEIHREICWFEGNLDVPRAFTVQARRPRGARRGVCWFRDSAADHVSRARYMAFLLRDMGVPVDTVIRDRAGTVLWSDAHQVVALPDPGHPVVFH